MANPFAMMKANAPPSADVIDVKVDRMRANARAKESEHTAVVADLRRKSKELYAHFAGSKAKFSGIIGAVGGGYSWQTFSEFVLKTLASGDPNHILYKYRAAIPGILIAFGDDILGKEIANDPLFVAAMQGMVGAAAANFAADWNRSPGSKASVKGLSDGDHVSGADLVEACDGIEDLEMLVSSGAIRPRLVKKLIQAIADDEQEGKAAVAEVCASIADGIDPETGGRANKASAVVEKARKAYSKLVRQIDVPPQVKRKDAKLLSQLKEIARLKAQLAQQGNQGGSNPEPSDEIDDSLEEE